MLELNWIWKSFVELTPAELYAALKLRAQVFVVEQNCVYCDLDDLDVDSEHLFGWLDGELRAYLRLVPAHRTHFGLPSIGRVVIAQSARGSGVGRELMRLGMARAQQRFPGAQLRVEAQAHLEAFYVSLGFVRISESYLEDGIAHVSMLR